MNDETDEFLNVLADYDSTLRKSARFPEHKPVSQTTAVPMIAQEPIEHTAFLEAGTRIARAHRRFRQRGSADGVLIAGQSGVGKSYLVDWYVRRFPRTEMPERTIIPALKVATPTKPTTAKLTRAVLQALGDPAPARGKEEEQLARMHRFLQECEVQIILIEEFQQFFDYHSAATYGITDWIKNQHDISHIPFVLLGLPRATKVIQQNDQLCRRFGCRYYIEPFNGDSEEKWNEFRGVLKALQARLPIPAPKLHHPDIARRFLFASEGLIDYVVRILNEALAVAHRRNCEIDLAILAEAFNEQVWRGAPPDLNPFLTDGALRSLRGPGEPFAQWDDTRL